jgi:FkbM family methyltransferase
MIIFDVGANNGKTFLHHALDGHRVYAFEPTPKLISDIKEWLHPKIFPNYNLIEKAISLENGKTTFNIAGQGDWGCSSLLEFSDNLEVTWAGRTDFKVNYSSGYIHRTEWKYSIHFISAHRHSGT